MSLSIPVRGFVPGQTVPLKINLKNDSNVRVSKIRIVLKKVIIYLSFYRIVKQNERKKERKRTNSETMRFSCKNLLS